MPKLGIPYVFRLLFHYYVSLTGIWFALQYFHENESYEQIAVTFGQPENISPSIDVTLLGMVIEDRFSQPLKANPWMLLTPFGIVIDFMFVHA